MKSNALFIPALLLAAGCNQSEPKNNGVVVANESAAVPTSKAPATPAPHVPAPQPVPAPGTSGALPDDRTPLPEPSGPIDPKSAEAAAQVVQHYGALIEQKRWSESWKLWSDAGAAREFDRNWRGDSDVHLEVGKPGAMEGAAGSSYLTVPVVFYGKKIGGGGFRENAAVILRRVNDVPGSTEAQRHWHIERIDLKASS